MTQHSRYPVAIRLAIIAAVITAVSMSTVAGEETHVVRRGSTFAVSQPPPDPGLPSRLRRAVERQNAESGVDRDEFAWLDSSSTSPEPPANRSPDRRLPSGPRASVHISKAESAIGQPGCQHPSCEWIRVSISGFPPNASLPLACHGAGDAFWRSTVRSDGSGKGSAQPCYFGFPGERVWAEVSGIRSNEVIWGVRGPSMRP